MVSGKVKAAVTHIAECAATRTSRAGGLGDDSRLNRAIAPPYVLNCVQTLLRFQPAVDGKEAAAAVAQSDQRVPRAESSRSSARPLQWQALLSQCSLSAALDYLGRALLVIRKQCVTLATAAATAGTTGTTAAAPTAKTSGSAISSASPQSSRPLPHKKPAEGKEIGPRAVQHVVDKLALVEENALVKLLYVHLRLGNFHAVLSLARTRLFHASYTFLDQKNRYSREQ